MQPAPASTPRWSSGPAFYLATIGAAVGLGSIWRLPYQAGSTGGSAFILLFTAACLLIATPLLVAEFLIGRHARTSPPRAAGVVAAASGRSRRWNFIGVLGTAAAFPMMAGYTVVAGWVLAYAWKCGAGGLVGLNRAEVAGLWKRFLASPAEIAAWQLAFLCLAGVVSTAGVRRGIEVASRVREPLLLLLLAILASYALATGDARAGLRFAFTPDWSAITPRAALAAVGQAFYATGVGSGMMLAYGAYVGRDTSLVRAALLISGSILLVSLLATLTIFPLVFGYGMNPAQGPELVFEVLATVFAEMPGGRLMGTLFFVLLVLSALTPSIAGFEPVVAWVEQRGVSRLRSVVSTLGVAWVLGIGAALSFSAWAGWYPLGAVPLLANRTVFDLLDFIPSNLLLPAGALGTSIFAGWRIRAAILEAELAETTPFARRWCRWALRFLCPAALLLVFATALT